MASALGVRFLDGAGQELAPGGGSLKRLHSLDLSALDPRVRDCEFAIASDVDNPLTGPDGAARVYGPQKGASREQVDLLDKGLARLGALALEAGLPDVAGAAGAGAAGGLGFGLMAFLGARSASGAALVMDAVRFGEKLAGCALALTGEGRVDAQTGRGKTVSAVASAGAARGIPVVALAGEINGDLTRLEAAGLTAAFSILPGPLLLADAMARTALELERTCRQLGFLLRSLLPDINRS